MSRLMGLDVGDKRIGIALSDESRLLATPHSVYNRVGFGPDRRYFAKLAQELSITTLVLGLPYNMDGSLGFQSDKVRAFAEQLESEGLEIEFIDERLTTVQANRALIEDDMRRDKRKTIVDRVAAALILQAYLDTHHSK